MDPSPTKRSTRQKKPSLKALESQFLNNLQHSGFVAKINSDDEEPEFQFSDDDVEMCEIEAPKLLHDDEHIRGEDIFKFHTRKQRNSLANKVAESCGAKTPNIQRMKMKEMIAAKIREEESGSEYEHSEASSSESESQGSGESSDSDEEPQKKMSQLKISNLKADNNRKTKGTNKYTIQTDEYFASTGKNKTSNNTLDKLDTPRLPQYELQKILSNMKLSKEHDKAVNRLLERNNSQFDKWLYILNENFSILVYGLGSKRNVLQNFQNTYLKNLPVIVVNGFFPTLSIKNVLDGIIVDMLELKENPGNLYEACDLIEEEFKKIPETHLYLIVHNIEGDMICNGKAQNVLSRLAAVRNIHLIASIDHINGPLIWDHSKLSKFNYIWWDVTSFLPYIEETSFERSMMVQKTGSLALSSLKNVFLSLTTNSKSIYLIIAKHQLENAKNQYYQGLAFKDLYMSCRESFIVSSDLALRAQLTEFVDHKMVKLKRSYDGAEYLQIPLPNALLQKFLDEQE
ncbi:unnamed protein product [Brassicogethes aeneus]|uniref:Origin recognition complex subunit 2 n=1 Tax=Brassicogethes aeneus TaxID=1431903 RepID=A0A9P0FJU6_BRAAE|nr:unnamed protein product [Brassicogethes aeneus]